MIGAFYMIKEGKKNIILIVDDDDDIRKTLSYLLQKRGFITEEARNGIESLKLVAVSKPDVIILDVSMPEMDGILTCQLLKNNPKSQDIPIIFLSAQDEPTNLINGFSGAEIEYIEKPCNFEYLLGRIHHLLNN